MSSALTQTLAQDLTLTLAEMPIITLIPNTVPNPISLCTDLKVQEEEIWYEGTIGIISYAFLSITVTLTPALTLTLI